MSPRDKKPPPEDDGRTQMLKVDEPEPEPAANPDDNPGATAFMKVEAPAAPQRRRAAPTADEPPPASVDDNPGATAFLKAPPPAAPARRKSAPTIEDTVPGPVEPPPLRRSGPIARPKPPPPEPAPAPEGATQMLDIRSVPSPEEMRQQAAKKAALAEIPKRKKMPEEIEVPVEHLHEQIHEHAHGGGHAAGGGFNMQVALSSALLAVLAAVSALMSGHYANEAMIEQIKASDQWAFYQAKSIKSSVLTAKMETLQGMGRPVSAGDEDKRAQYETEQKDITKKAKTLEEESHHHLNIHQVLARTVTLMQIAIALAAIAVLTKKKPLWFMSLALGAVGAVILVQALVFTH